MAPINDYDPTPNVPSILYTVAIVVAVHYGRKWWLGRRAGPS